jgi:hypothetical protein
MGVRQYLQLGPPTSLEFPPRYYVSMDNDSGMILTGENRIIRRWTCPSATLTTINSTWTDLGANSGLRGEGPATNSLSHDTAVTYIINNAYIHTYMHTHTHTRIHSHTYIPTYVLHTYINTYILHTCMHAYIHAHTHARTHTHTHTHTTYIHNLSLGAVW